MKHCFSARVGPVGFRIGSAWPSPVAALRTLYAGYPDCRIPDFTVRLEPARPWRRWVRPSVRIAGDHVFPEALPLPLSQGLLVAEMAMNLQVALGERRFLLLHAACVERDGRALILTGESGSGKSTMSALLMEAGWRFLGDEFVLIDPATGQARPFPRPVSLKNASIETLAARVDEGRFGPVIHGTPKGRIRHLRPDVRALAAMDDPATPALILFPRFGHETVIRDVPPGELFARLTQASTNYVALGEQGFATLTRLATKVPAQAVDYADTDSGMALIHTIWDRL